jgi:hypothetical protein
VCEGVALEEKRDPRLAQLKCGTCLASGRLRRTAVLLPLALQLGRYVLERGFSELDFDDGVTGRLARRRVCRDEVIRGLKHPRPRISGAFVLQSEKCGANTPEKANEKTDEPVRHLWLGRMARAPVLRQSAPALSSLHDRDGSVVTATASVSAATMRTLRAAWAAD